MKRIYRVEYRLGTGRIFDITLRLRDDDPRARAEAVLDALDENSAVTKVELARP